MAVPLAFVVQHAQSFVVGVGHDTAYVTGHVAQVLRLRNIGRTGVVVLEGAGEATAETLGELARVLGVVFRAVGNAFLAVVLAYVLIVVTLTSNTYQHRGLLDRLANPAVVGDRPGLVAGWLVGSLVLFALLYPFGPLGLLGGIGRGLLAVYSLSWRAVVASLVGHLGGALVAGYVNGMSVALLFNSTIQGQIAGAPYYTLWAAIFGIGCFIVLFLQWLDDM